MSVRSRTMTVWSRTAGLPATCEVAPLRLRHSDSVRWTQAAALGVLGFQPRANCSSLWRVKHQHLPNQPQVPLPCTLASLSLRLRCSGSQSGEHRAAVLGVWGSNPDQLGVPQTWLLFLSVSHCVSVLEINSVLCHLQVWLCMCVCVCVLFIGIVQCKWACLTWKSAIEIKLLLLLLLFSEAFYGLHCWLYHYRLCIKTIASDSELFTVSAPFLSYNKMLFVCLVSF